TEGGSVANRLAVQDGAALYAADCDRRGRQAGNADCPTQSRRCELGECISRSGNRNSLRAVGHELVGERARGRWHEIRYEIRRTQHTSGSTAGPAVDQTTMGPHHGNRSQYRQSRVDGAERTSAGLHQEQSDSRGPRPERRRKSRTRAIAGDENTVVRWRWSGVIFVRPAGRREEV